MKPLKLNLRLIKLFEFTFIFLFFPLLVYAGTPPWQVFKSTHFLISYKSAKESQLDQLSSKAEEYYNKITDDLGFNRFDFWTWNNRARIYLFDNQQEYMSATGDPVWSGGQAQVNSKLIQTFITAKGFIENVLPHEMAHIIFREMVGFNNPCIPLWLDEGVASFQGKNISFNKTDLANRIERGGFLSLDDLNKTLSVTSETTGGAELFYSEAYSLVRYLITTFGKDKFVLFCQNLRDKRNLSRALVSTYSFNSLADFENSWKKYILQ